MDEIRSFLLAIIESSADAIIGLRSDGEVISWNPGARRIYAYAAEEMLGTSIARLFLPDRLDELHRLLANLRRGEQLHHYQSTHLRKGGIPFPVSLSLSPVIESFGRVVGASFIARDLSERFQIEKSLHETEQRYRQWKSSLELAQQIQETLLPSPEELKGDLDLYARTLYSEEIGGDYYDLFTPRSQPEHLTGLAVGDVSGHGTGAALLMAMAKGVLQTEVEHFPFDLVAIMNRLNRFFCDFVEAGRMMTLFLALIDQRSRLLSWCSAGQGPVYVYRYSGQHFEELPCTGPPLGALDAVEYESRTLELHDNDILVIGTDGLWEACSPQGEMFTIERVRQLLATWQHKPAAEICEGILARVREFHQRETLDDDTSLMIVKIPARAQLTEAEASP